MKVMYIMTINKAIPEYRDLPVMRVFYNAKAGQYHLSSNIDPEIIEFHRKMPDYFPTPIKTLSKTAEKYRLENLYLKIESERMGLPAFKVLGGSWAVWKLLSEMYNLKLSDWRDIVELRELLDDFPPVKLVTATDGNHGRGVARIARLFGLRSKIFMPQGTSPARIEAIYMENAEVIVIPGNYDDAVIAASIERDDSTFLIQDTSWKGYEQIPGWVIDGYSTMMTEIESDLKHQKMPMPDVIFVQIGVGSLAAAVVSYFKSENFDKTPTIIGVEPEKADCAFISVKNNEIISLAGEQDSIMAGLNCGTVASIAFPLLRDGVDCFLSIEDIYAEQAMRLLYDEGVETSESGASGLAGLIAIMESPDKDEILSRLNFSADSTILFFLTEGVTDRLNFDRIIQS